MTETSSRAGASQSPGTGQTAHSPGQPKPLRSGACARVALLPGAVPVPASPTPRMEKSKGVGGGVAEEEVCGRGMGCQTQCPASFPSEWRQVGGQREGFPTNRLPGATCSVDLRDVPPLALALVQRLSATSSIEPLLWLRSASAAPITQRHSPHCQGHWWPEVASALNVNGPHLDPEQKNSGLEVALRRLLFGTKGQWAA